MREAILSQLSPDYPWKEHLHWFETVGSTNDLLKTMARQGAPHGTVVIADRQTGGHGRMGRSFQSPGGMGVYLSILLRPECAPGELMHLTCAAAVAMCNAAESVSGLRPGIKWTNDLVCGKRKLGGILTELGLSPRGKVDYAIIGVGINCTQQEQDFLPEIRSIAGSLAMATGENIAPSKLAAAMMDAFAHLNLWEREGLLRQYRADCITLGKEVSLVRGEEVRYGTALDIDPDGALIVRFADGHLEAVNSGEISVRGMYGYVS